MKRTVLVFAFMALLLAHGARADPVLPEPALAVTANAIPDKKIDMETATTTGTIITIVVLLLGLACGGVITMKRFSPKPKAPPKDRGEPTSDAN